MFVREEVRLTLSFPTAHAGLTALAQDSQLLTASRAAYSDGVAGLARVGPPGSWPGLSKLVMIHVGDVSASDGLARLPLRWEATGPGSSLFPALDADISLSPDGTNVTELTLTGVYRPPLGSLGAMLDRVVLSRVAAATVRGFLGQLAQALEARSTATERSNLEQGQY